MTAETVKIFFVEVYLEKGRFGGEQINIHAKCSLHLLINVIKYRVLTSGM
jgi:hypothetical protein